MKYLGVFLISIFFLSGCGTSNVTENTNLYGSKKATNDVPSVVKESNKEDNTNNNSMRHLPDHKDLAAEYNKAVIKTNKGDITVSFYADESPITVNNFMNLADSGFYNDVHFHRVMENFMIQGGDPLSKEEDKSRHGTGGPGYTFEDEINAYTLEKGSLAMANAGPGTNGSQFFIVTAAETPWLDGRHTNFGKVEDGMDVVEAIEKVETDGRDNPIEDVVIESIELLK